MPTYEELYPQSDENENENQDQDQPTRSRCRHIFTAGRRCGSPCLRNTDFCYYHHTTRRPVNNPRERRNRTDVFDLPNPEDGDAARAAVTQIMHAIAHNNIDLKRAGMLLYSLQISLCTLPPHPRPAPLKTANSIPLKDIVEDVIYEEPHGFIAPEAVYEEPEELKPRKSFARQLYEEVERYEARQAAEAQQELQAKEARKAHEAAAASATETWGTPSPKRPDAIDLRAAAEQDAPETAPLEANQEAETPPLPPTPDPLHPALRGIRPQHTRSRLICLQSASSKALSTHALEKNRCRCGNHASRTRRMQPSGHRAGLRRTRRALATGGPAARPG